MLRVWCLIGVLLTFAVPAKAATTVYAASVFSQSGTITNAANALGAANGSNATVGRGAILTLLLGQAVTGANFTVTGVRAGGGAVQIFLGAVIAGVPTFTTNINFTGAGTSTFDFSAACAALSPTGCTLMRVRVTGPPGSSFAFDGVSGVSSAPEPRVWALMIMAFIAVAWRLKAVRRNSPQFAAFA